VMVLAGGFGVAARVLFVELGFAEAVPPERTDSPSGGSEGEPERSAGKEKKVVDTAQPIGKRG